MAKRKTYGTTVNTREQQGIAKTTGQTNLSPKQRPMSARAAKAADLERIRNKINTTGDEKSLTNDEQNLLASSMAKGTTKYNKRTGVFGKSRRH